MSVSSDPSAACAVQIVSLGSEDDDHAFNLNEEALTAVLNKVSATELQTAVRTRSGTRSGTRNSGTRNSARIRQS